MPAIQDCEWEISWDRHTFSEYDANEIATALEEVAGREVARQPIARYATSVDVAFILSVYFAGLAVTEFFKAFGGKVGEKIGEEVGSDLVKIYSKIKGLIADKFTKNKSDKGFQCLFRINIDRLLVTAVIHGKSEDAGLVSIGIDCFEQVFSDALSILSEFDLKEEILEIRMVFDDQAAQWTPLFLVTNESVYEIESSGSIGIPIVYQPQEATV